MIYVNMENYKSLKESALDKKHIARSIILSHKTPEKVGKVIVLVEGKDDICLYEKFFKDDTVDIHDCHGCDIVESVHNTFEQETSNKKFVSIFDSDFKRINERLKNRNNIFYTDVHDSEMLMVCMPGVMKATTMKISPRCNYVDLKNRIELELQNVSLLKWYNMTRHLSYTFEGLDLAHLSYGSQISESSAIQYFVPTINSPRKFPINAFHKFIKSSSRPIELDQITNGHDFITRWASIIKRELHQQKSDDELRAILCDFVGVKHIKTTMVYNELLKWSQRESLPIVIQ